MLVEPLKTHIDLNIAKFTNYALLREACVSYCEVVQQQQAANGPQPMDVSNLQQSIDALQTELASLKGSKGKGKGKGNDSGGKGAKHGQRQNVASSSSNANAHATTDGSNTTCRPSLASASRNSYPCFGKCRWIIEQQCAGSTCRCRDANPRH